MEFFPIGFGSVEKSINRNNMKSTTILGFPSINKILYLSPQQ